MPFVVFPRQILIDQNGKPRIAAKMRIWDAGTTDPHPAYTGPDLAVPHPEEILSIGNGYFPSVWIDPDGGDYKITFYDADNVPLPLDQDNIPAAEAFTSERIAKALDSLKRTEQEIADNVNPVNYAYPPGDARRYVTGIARQDYAWYSFGHLPNYVDPDTFTIDGDHVAEYPVGSQLLIVSATTSNYARVSSVSFSAGLTTVNCFMYLGNIPTSPLSVSVARMALLRHPIAPAGNEFWDNVNGTVQHNFVNQNNGTAAIAKLTVSNSIDAGVAIVVIGANYSANPYLTDSPNGPAVLIHTGFPAPIVFGVGDQSRLILQTITNPIQFFGSEVAAAFYAYDAAATAKSWVAFFRKDKVTRKGRIGFDNTDNRLTIVNEETGPVVIAASLGKVSLSSNTNRFTLSGLPNYANDAAAASGGLDIGDLYRNGSQVMIRVA